jgi:hypothetical protein
VAPGGDEVTYAEVLERRVMVAAIVGEHWRDWAVRQDHTNTVPTAIVAHPLACVLAALAGEDDPNELGLEPDSTAAKAIRALRPFHQSDTESP